MNKNTLFLIVLFLLLGGGTWYYFNQPESEKMQALRAERDFKVERDQIGKIFLVNRRRNEELTIERIDEEYWRVNDKYLANPSVMKQLLAAISSIQVKYVPAASAMENIVKGLATNQIKVELYDRQNELIKTYYVGGDDAHNSATYMILDNSEQPFAVEIPHMVGVVSTRYNLSLHDLRDKGIMRYKPEEITYLSIDYPKQRNKSFVLEKKEGTWSVEPLYDTTPKIDKKVAPGTVEGVLSNYKKKVAESLINESPEKDEYLQKIPFAIVTVNDLNGKETTAVFYPRYYKDDEGKILTDQKIDKYYIWLNDQDFLQGQHRVLDNIFVGYDSFF